MAEESLLSSEECLEAGLERIREALEAKPKADIRPKRLKVRDVRIILTVFQPRSLDGRMAEGEAHLKALVQGIGNPDNPKELDPITVWWAGSIGWVVIDGHHRLEAYHRLKLRGLSIPVQVFQGSLDEARAEAIAANSKDKLPMREDDKLNMAWRLVLTSKLSKARIATACGCGERTVANMRAKLKAVQTRADELGQEVDLFDLAGKTWKMANWLSPDELLGGNKPPVNDDDIRDQLYKTAQRMAKALTKSLGRTVVVNPESFAMAIEIIEERLPVMLMSTEAWQDHAYALAEESDEESDSF